MIEVVTLEPNITMHFSNKFELMDYLITRAMNLKKCFKFIKREMGHLYLKCPIVNDMICVLASEEEISFIYNQLVKRDLWKPGELTGW